MKTLLFFWLFGLTITLPCVAQQSTLSGGSGGVPSTNVATLNGNNVFTGFNTMNGSTFTGGQNTTSFAMNTAFVNALTVSNTLTSQANTVLKSVGASNIQSGQIIGIASNSFIGPGTISISANGTVTGNGAATFTSTFLTNKVFTAGGTTYHVISVISDSSMRVLENTTQAGGTSYTVVPSAIVGVGSGGSVLTGGGFQVAETGTVWLTSPTVANLFLGNQSFNFSGFGITSGSQSTTFTSYSNATLTTPVTITDGAPNNALLIRQEGVAMPNSYETTSTNQFSVAATGYTNVNAFNVSIVLSNTSLVTVTWSDGTNTILSKSIPATAVPYTFLLKPNWRVTSSGSLAGIVVPQ